MAKTPSGLPENFDIGVSASDLSGPARIPGYLDEDPVVAFANAQKQQIAMQRPPVSTPTFVVPPAAQAAPVASQPVAFTKPQPPVAPPVFVQAPAAPQQTAVAASVEQEARKADVLSLKQPEVRKRFQINLDADSERMLEEIMDLLSSQSAENRIKISELFQALLMNLYKAKGEIALGSLPVRGRWGSPTAKAFPVSLAESFREAIIAHEASSGGNPFKKAVGG